MTAKINRVVLIVGAFLLWYGCNNQTGKTVDTTDTGMEADLNFDSVLHCYDYSFLDHYFYTPDYGCIYDPKDKNPFGNLWIYLVPREEIDSSRSDSIAQRINSLDVDGIKRTFQPYVFVIPGEHLNYNAYGDPVYYQKENYTEKLYGLDSTGKSWVLIDTIAISGNVENEKEQAWREGFIRSTLR